MAQLGATVSDGVIQEVARVTGTDPLELPPLYEVLDPEALDDMIEAMPEGEITFAYAGVVVAVQHDGVVSVTERDVGMADRDVGVTEHDADANGTEGTEGTTSTDDPGTPSTESDRRRRVDR